MCSALAEMIPDFIARPYLASGELVSLFDDFIAKDRGINVEVTTRDQQGAYEGYIRLTVTTGKMERSVAGSSTERLASGTPPSILISVPVM